MSNTTQGKVPPGYILYEPIVNSGRKNIKFRLYLSPDKSTIMKINNHVSEDLELVLERKNFSSDFEKILSGECFNEELKMHIPTGSKVGDDASYESEYIQGIRLDLIDIETLSGELRKKVLEECEVLLANLKKADSVKSLIGDWALHNLIFSSRHNRIFNVDLEGFLTYNPLPEWANYDVIRTWIDDVINLLDG
jgi:hypothetical protein